MNLTDPLDYTSLKPSIVAAYLIFARNILRRTDTEQLPSTNSAIIALAGAGKSQAYAMLSRLEAASSTLERPPGPPPSSTPSDTVSAILVAVRNFLMEHPGAVAERGSRNRYSETFRRFVLGLIAPNGLAVGLTVEQTAEAVGIPLGSLKDWLRGRQLDDEIGNDDELKEQLATEEQDDCKLTSHPEIATIITEYRQWHGDFSSFCDHLRIQLRLSYGRTFIASVLQAAGLRRPGRRKQPQPPWSAETYRRHFPGAQWLGDGTTLAIVLNNQRFVFCAEVVSDVDSNAVVGIEIADVENEKALLASFDAGLTTTGEHPLSLTLDNKPSNHTAGVNDSVQPTIVIHATPGRGQAKASLEGTFGLFAQSAPSLVLEGRSNRELARSALALVLTTWAWARNGKPRPRLGGKSPADYYRSRKPSEAETLAAREWIAELRRRAELTQQTRERRADPARVTLLVEALQRLDIADTDNRLAISLARYSNEAIMRGIAVFETKRELDTLPRNADPGPYLGGIIRHTDAKLEIESTAERLLELRIRHRQLSMRPLGRELEYLRSTVLEDELPEALVTRALDAKGELDYRFYAGAACDALARLPAATGNPLFEHLCRYVAATFSATKERRHDMIARLSKTLIESAA